MTDKTYKKGLWVLVLIPLIALIILLTQVATTGIKPRSVKIKQIPSSTKPYVAIVNVTGVIQAKGQEYNQKWILSTIKTLKEDSKNLGILLFIDSPGGTVYHSDETYLALLDYKAAGKSVYAYFGSLAASGGYYIGCSADKIFANRNCLTGSIGVITAQSIDATEFLKKIGIKSVTIHAGRNKNMLNYNEPATEEQIEIMQTLADEAYEQFTSIVAESRRMNIEKVKKLADGRIYSASQAKKNGLIDDIYTFEEAQTAVKRELDRPELTFKSYKYIKSDSLKSILMESFSAIKNPQSLIPGNTMSYLYTGN